MSMTYRRIAVLTTTLCFVAGATALAIEVTPSTSITLQTRTRGMGGDPDAQRVEIAATSVHATVQLESNTCREKGLTDTIAGSVKTGHSEIEGTGRPKEALYYYNIALQSKTSEGTCALIFSDGMRHATVNVRIVKP